MPGLQGSLRSRSVADSKTAAALHAHGQRPHLPLPRLKTCSNSGYQGRIAIFELLLVSDDIRSLILENSSSTAIRDAAVANGMTLLRIDGWQKVQAGITSIAEVLRVT